MSERSTIPADLLADLLGVTIAEVELKLLTGELRPGLRGLIVYAEESTDEVTIARIAGFLSAIGQAHGLFDSPEAAPIRQFISRMGAA